MSTFYQSMRQCYRKSRFGIEKIARKKANKIAWDTGNKMYVYGCTKCGGYHLTKSSTADGKVF